jgi:non-specific serine/threonine protein kinase
VLVLGLVAVRRAAYDRARACFEDALTVLGPHGDATWRAFALKNLGFVADKRGDRARADVLYEQALAQFREIGNTFGTAITLINMAKSARDRGDLSRATALYAEALALRWDQGDKILVASCLRGLASVAAFARQYQRAVRLFGATEALREAIGAGESRSASDDSILAEARRALGEQAFAATWEAGRTMPLAEAVAESLATQPDATADVSTGREAARGQQIGLTRKEVEVLRLLREGLTNREIGERLYISPRTAQTHVQNIMEKLDVGSRTAAAAFAVEHGLV